MSLYEEAAVEYRLRAIQALSEEIRKSQGPNSLHEDEQDAILAIIQILLLHDVSHGQKRVASLFRSLLTKLKDCRDGYLYPWYTHYRGNVSVQTATIGGWVE